MIKIVGGRLVRRLVFTAGTVVALLALTSTARAQNLVVDPLEIITSQVFFISDFDIAGGGNPAELFRFGIRNVNPTTPTNATIEMTFRKENGLSPIVNSVTEPFLMAPQGQLLSNRRITYRDFRGLGENPDIRVASFRYDPNAVDNVIDNVLRTGRLPNGRYFLDVIVRDLTNSEGPVEIYNDSRELFISSLPSLDPVSPGMPAEDRDCPIVFTNLPQFKWDSEADEFILTVCELLPTNSGPEDVMQNPPRLRIRLRRNADFFGSPAFQYPSEGLPLQEGRTYYWQINAIAQTQTGPIELPGQIWCFRVSAFGGSENELLLQQLLALLQSLGLQDVTALFEAGGPLAGHLPNGNVILDGKRIDLNDLITQLRMSAKKLNSFSVE